jgi:ATP-dependent RNA helicase DeaD
MSSRIISFITNRGSSWKEDADDILKNAGYHEFTVLQEKVIPLILKGKDIAVYTRNLKGKTASFIIPILLSLKRDNKGVKAVILAASSVEVRKVYMELLKFRKDRQLVINALYDEDDTREKRGELAKKPDILIGTPMRIIDHIRRGDLEFPHIKYIVINELDDVTGTGLGFQEDIQFIFSKLPVHKQIIYISGTIYKGSSDHYANGLSSILRKTKVLTEEEIVSKAPHIYYSTEPDNKLQILQKLILADKIESFLLFCDKEEEAKEIGNFLMTSNIKTIIIDKELTGNLSPKDNYIIATDKVIFNQALTWISYLINFNVPEDKDLYFKRLVNLSSNYKSVITLSTKIDFEKLQKIQETSKVNIKNEEIPKAEDVTSGLIAKILQKIKEEEDPDELNKFRRLVKKNVPFFLRSYFAAYLFKQIVGEDIVEVKTENNGNFTTLFISIGKNRHVYPKDLVNLLMSNLSIKRSEIGEIKILDNYSFVDISLEQATKAISKLSGMNFRRRRLTVNLARKKGE